MINRSQLEADPLSELVRLAGLEVAVSGELRAAGRWCLRMPRPEGLKFFTVLQGEAWLALGAPAQDGPLRLLAGDVVVMHWDQPFVLGSDLAAPCQDVQDLLAPEAPDTPHPSLTLGSGAELHLIGGHVRLDPERGRPLAGVLPPLVHLRGEAVASSGLRWLVERLAHERSRRAIGHQLMTTQLAQMMFLQALREHLSQSGALAPGWMRAMTDPQLLPAIMQMHREPGRAWLLAELAQAASMSRTAFAVRFKALAGVAPLTYLAQWRMQLARHALVHDPRPLSSWMEDLGYGSESAFSHAFKRVTGRSPNQYRRAVGRATAPTMTPWRTPPPASQAGP